MLGLLIGVGFGMIGALRPGKVGDDVGQGVAVVGLGVPSFVIGTALVTFLSSHFHYFPSSQGYASLFSDPWLNLQQIFFPALVLSIGIGAAIMRTTRAAVLEVSSQNFVRTARGKGITGARRHLAPPVPERARPDRDDVRASSSATCSAAPSSSSRSSCCPASAACSSRRSTNATSRSCRASRCCSRRRSCS